MSADIDRRRRVPGGAPATRDHRISYSGGISSPTWGRSTRYGSGDDARIGAGRTEAHSLQDRGARRRNDGTVDRPVADGDGRRSTAATGKPLPAKSAAYYVVAVPTTAKTVDLVLSDSGLNQTLSLLDGKPGANNVQVLARKNRQATPLDRPVHLRRTRPSVTFADGSAGSNQHRDRDVHSRRPGTTRIRTGRRPTASSPSTAILAHQRRLDQVLATRVRSASSGWPGHLHPDRRSADRGQGSRHQHRHLPDLRGAGRTSPPARSTSVARSARPTTTRPGRTRNRLTPPVTIPLPR